MARVKKCTTKEDVLEAVNERDVKLFDPVTDTLGIIKSWQSLPNSSKKLWKRVMFDGSSIQGLRELKNLTWNLRLTIYVQDPSMETCCRCSCQNPWRCVSPDGQRLRRPQVRSQVRNPGSWKMGYSMNVGPELEFFLFKLDANGNPPQNLRIREDTSISHLLTVHRMYVEILTMLSNIWASRSKPPITKSHLPSMKWFRFGDVLSTADNVVTLNMW